MSNLFSDLVVGTRADGTKYWHIKALPHVDVIWEWDQRDVVYQGFYIAGAPTLNRYARLTHSGMEQRAREESETCGPFSDYPGENTYTRLDRRTYSGVFNVDYDGVITGSGELARYYETFTCLAGPLTGYYAPLPSGAPIPYNGSGATTETTHLDHIYEGDEASGWTVTGGGHLVTLSDLVDLDDLFDSVTPGTGKTIGLPSTSYTGRSELTDADTSSFDLTRNQATYSYRLTSLIPGKAYVVRGTIQRRVNIIDVDPGEWTIIEEVAESFTASTHWHLIGGTTESSDLPATAEITPSITLPFEEGWEYRLVDVSIEAAYPIQA